MATLVLTALGTVIGGPIGGLVGSLVGSQIDAELFGPGDREGPRLKELAVTTSSYGTPIPRHFGTMRAAGSIIWATDLIESSEKTGGGKGQPSTKTYSYSSSFAVALSSRPVSAIGRIWADGNLLRGAAGDLKTGGSMRFYSGYGDQQPDPLIASAEGPSCPAFRGLAYAVFEDLQLADFGNRLPSLTFEVFADTGEVSLVDLVAGTERAVTAERDLPALVGFSDEGGALANALGAISTVYPLASDASAESLRLFSGDDVGPEVATLPPPVSDPTEESFGGLSGSSTNRKTGSGIIPSGLRYYDTGRDYQAGMQLAGGRAIQGQSRLTQFPGALAASDARSLAEMAAKRARAQQDRLEYRIAELDPGLTPGSFVAVPQYAGIWRIEGWEWREFGLELSLSRLPATATPAIATDAGRALDPIDSLITPTILAAFELPWDGAGSPDTRQVFAAPSSTSAGWTGAVLYAVHNGALETLGGSGRERSTLGSTANALEPASSLIANREETLEVQLASPDFALETATMEALAQGANRALLGEEIIQFAQAEHLGNSFWQLRGIVRGRGGTEHLALSPHPAGTPFILLDGSPRIVDQAIVSTATDLAAIGLADEEPSLAPITGAGSTLRPLAPVHPRAEGLPDGSIRFCWTRRARGAWRWEGTVEPPLVEQSELYEVGYGDTVLPDRIWQLSEPEFSLTESQSSQLVADHGSGPLWVRQIGTHARSLSTLLTTLS